MINKGFTFIQTLIGIALFAIAFISLLSLLQLGIQVITQSRARVTALALANQKIETIRNMSYGGIGTIGGIPVGPIPQTEMINRNNIDFTVKTTIINIDDPFDELAPDDFLASDYKKAKIEVSWAGKTAPKAPVALITDIAPKGIETEAGGGTLSISVFDANGIGVGQANVHIVNDSLIPGIDASYSTDNDGHLILAGAPTSTEAYQITVSKTDYSTDKTYGIEEVANPSKPHVSVFEGMLTEISFAIDELSYLTVRTKGPEESGFLLIPNVTFDLAGAKIIGTDLSGNPIYKYTQTRSTNVFGIANVTNLEWDSYTFLVDKESTGLDLVTTTPPQPINLLPDTTQSIDLILEAENTLLTTVLDASTTEPIFGASVKLINSGLGYEQTLPSDELGKAFFIPLENETYALEIEKEGYINYNNPINISGKTEKTINLYSQ